MICVNFYLQNAALFTRIKTRIEVESRPALAAAKVILQM